MFNDVSVREVADQITSVLSRPITTSVIDVKDDKVGEIDSSFINGGVQSIESWGETLCLIERRDNERRCWQIHGSTLS
jgi:hypothetical protein